MEFSREFNLAPNIVEKDYVLGWVLAGISNHEELGSNWVFKGGTYLKKCYFETYRFSEDLDFTIIDPYSLRQTMDGTLLLYAVKHQTGEDRSYRVDRIQGANVTKMPFNPRYAVELTTSGPISVPSTIRKSTGLVKSRFTETRIVGSHSRRRRSTSGLKYVFQCPLCEKQFTHNSYKASLNQHKDKQGYPCSGGTGIYITTKY
jgi:hypothetical protein